jgi:hypothetical protein
MNQPPSPAPTLAAVVDVVAGRTPQLECVDVELFSRILVRRGLAGLAVADVRTRGTDEGALADVWLELLAIYHRVAFHSTLVLESADRALSVLEAGGVPALLFKGTALFRMGVYGDPGARPLEDTDLLVLPDDAPRAVALLSAAGFEPWVPWRGARMGWLSSFSFTDRRAPGGVPVALDLHWATPYARLRLSGPWPEDPLWEEASLPLPKAEPHFALMAEHVLKHLRVVVHARGLADLARVAPRLADGAWLREQADRRGSLPGLRLVMALLRDRLGVHIPGDVLKAVGVPSRLGNRVNRRLSTQRLLGHEAQGGLGRAGGVLGDWTLIGSIFGSVREIARVLGPPGRWLRSRYPDTAWALARRLRYLRELTSWIVGSAPSPLSPNQEFEA